MTHLIIAISWPIAAVLIAGNARRVIALIIMSKTAASPSIDLKIDGKTIARGVTDALGGKQS